MTDMTNMEGADLQFRLCGIQANKLEYLARVLGDDPAKVASYLFAMTLDDMLMQIEKLDNYRTDYEYRAAARAQQRAQEEPQIKFNELDGYEDEIPF